MPNGYPKILAILFLAIGLGGCNQFGLRSNSIELGRDVTFLSKSSPQLGFVHSSNWQIREVPSPASGGSLLVLQFRPPNYNFTVRSVQSLWKATNCAMFNDRSKPSADGESKAGRALLIDNMISNFPSKRVPPATEKFLDANYERDEFENVTARVITHYEVEAVKTTTRNGHIVKSKKTTVPWYSFGQSQRIGDNDIYVFCSGDPGYHNHFEALADSLARTLKVF